MHFWNDITYFISRICKARHIITIMSERIQLLALCYNLCFPQIHYSYVNVLGDLDFQTLCSRRCHLDAHFLLISRMVLNFVVPCLKLMAFVFPTRNFWDVSSFTLRPSRKHCPSTWNASATNTVCKPTDIFSKYLVSLDYILKFLCLFLPSSLLLCISFYYNYVLSL